MNKPFKSVLFGAFAVAAIAVSSFVTTNTTYAMDTAATMQPDPSKIPLEIVPVCSDAASMTAKWKVTNKNTENVFVTWNNVENSKTGTYNAVNGESTLYTYYNAADPNNRTEFTYSGNVSATNAKAEACAPVVTPTPVCVDGRNQANLEATKLANNSYRIMTKNGALLCDDVTVFLSSYLLPANYDGTGFGGPTSYPQQLVNSVSATLTAGTTGETVLTVGLPDACNPYQVDLYYGPELTVVGAEGHGTRNIVGEIYPAEGTCEPCTPVEPPVVTPPVVTPPVVTPPVTPTTPVVPPTTTGNGAVSGTPAVIPAELPTTGGISSVRAIITTIVAGLATYMIMYLLQPKLRNEEE